MSRDETKPRPYIILPHFIYSSNMGCVGQRICGIIYGLSSEYGFCTAKDEYIGSLLCMSPGAVRRQIQQLTKDLYIRNIGSVQHRKLVLNYIDNADTKELMECSTQTRKNFAKVSEIRKNFAQTRKNFAYLPIIYKINNNIGHFKTNDLNAIDEKQAFQMLFDLFWDMYGNKQKKAETQTVFKKLSEEDIVALIASLPYVNEFHDKTNKTAFVPQKPHPTTFLRGRRWEDECYALKKIEKKGAADAVTADEGSLAESLERFRKISDGEAVTLEDADISVLAALGISVSSAAEEINIDGMKVFASRVRAVWDAIGKGEKK
ncbi:MAG TPA: hypothetical protein CFH81_08710 [Sulfurovum sp. UBA12169]|nr:MAG TPA: hypothetical protein CFH81_08710 [Sulfurovum sp. UBA12169]